MAPILTTGAGVYPAVAAGAGLSLDGSAHNTGISSGGAAATVTLTTTKTNNIIVVAGMANSAPWTGVSGSTLGAFTLRGVTTQSVFCFWKLASSILTNEVITISGPSTSYIAAIAFAVNGAKTSAPFDVNGVLPVLTGFGAPKDPYNISTTAANTFCFAVMNNTTGSPVAGTGGWTTIQANGDFVLAEYQIVSSAQASLACTINPVGSCSQGFGDAIVVGP